MSSIRCVVPAIFADEFVGYNLALNCNSLIISKCNFDSLEWDAVIDATA
jgi:hypothetical protein